MYDGRFEALRRAGWGNAKLRNYMEHLPSEVLDHIDEAETPAEAERRLNDAIDEQKATIDGEDA